MFRFSKKYYPHVNAFWFNQYKLQNNPLRIGLNGMIYNIVNDNKKICKKITINKYGNREVYHLLNLKRFFITPFVYESFKSKTDYYIIMEKYQSNLTTFITNPYKKPTLQNLIYISDLICRKVDILHKQNIAHRDIKPCNILITKNLNYNVQLIDFETSCSNNFIDNLEYGTKYYKNDKIDFNLYDYNYFKQDYFSLGIKLSLLFTDGKYNESIFFYNSPKENCKLIFKEIYENYNKEIITKKNKIDEDYIMNLCYILTSLMNIKNNETINLTKITKFFRMYLKN
mgnify:CR=1 FL=1